MYQGERRELANIYFFSSPGAACSGDDGLGKMSKG